MYYFDSDYMVGAHPEVMRRLVETNDLHTIGYGKDEYCAKARRRILDECGVAEGEVWFLEGGTQTNMLVITRLLDYNEGVIATDTAHINVHEAGAIEAAGHKVIALPNHNGLLDPEEVDRCLEDYNADDTREHIVRPGMVYTTYPSELGTIYPRATLERLDAVCRKWNIPLYIDGARLAYGLAARGSELTLRDIASLCDIFYIGGTKCGALFGEAVVATRPGLLPRFFSLCKQRGAVLAKGRLLGIQFETLFTDNLYLRIGHHAVDMAMRLRGGMERKGYPVFFDSPSNQQFFLLPNKKIEQLRHDFSFELWGPLQPEKTPVRFVTDFSTTPEAIDALIEAL